MSLIFFSCFGYPRDLHSFPTRRSSDLLSRLILRSGLYELRGGLFELRCLRLDARIHRACRDSEDDARSEEHTSELQSRVDLVCRLLLEKKKNDESAVL